MQISTAILLAGGEGTRLQVAVPGLAKCLAPVNGRAFIDYVIDHLQLQGITKFVFALGTNAIQVQQHLDSTWPALEKIYSVETTPLGTGGAIKKAADSIDDRNALVLNTDTLFKFDHSEASAFHQSFGAVCTLLLKPMDNTGRFGKVEINKQGSVIAFREKEANTAGLINAGVYLLNVSSFLQNNWPAVFSFEKDFLQEKVRQSELAGLVQDHYFIDIGIPGDYQKAQTELSCNLFTNE
jgi:D-glycero-alpha-D-manno-heptose 1-phosphate guanylyltransferase